MLTGLLCAVFLVFGPVRPTWGAQIVIGNGNKGSYNSMTYCDDNVRGEPVYWHVFFAMRVGTAAAISGWMIDDAVHDYE